MRRPIEQRHVEPRPVERHVDPPIAIAKPETPAVQVKPQTTFVAEQVGQQSWPASPEARIEKLRTGDFKFVVVDANGRPVPNANVELTQINSDFRFGTVSSTTLLTGDSDAYQRYRAELIKRFNTVELKRELSIADDPLLNNRLESARAAAVFLKQQGMFIRGGALTYREMAEAPEGARSGSPDEWRNEITRRINADMRALGDSVYLWDVSTNAASGDFWKRIGERNLNEAYVTARAANPKALLSYAEAGIESSDTAKLSEVMRQLNWLKANGAPVDIISDSVGMTGAPTAQMYSRWDAIARLGKHIEVTDAAVSSADAMRNLLVSSFSHPNVDGLILASFWAGDGIATDAASLVAQDWTNRDTLAVWDEYVLHRWRTSASTLTNGAGRGTIHGYFGTYKARVQVGDTWYEAYVGHHNYATEVSRIVLKN